MKCTDVRDLLPGAALGDLDAEPAREVEKHLADCPECRAERAGLAATVGALRAAPALDPSTERRLAAAAAMAKAQAGVAERLLVRPRRAWRGWAAAAAVAVLAAGVAAALRRAPAGPEFQVASVTGRADLLRRDRGAWRPLVPGEAVRAGDRILTGSGTVARLEFGGGSVTLDQNASVEIFPAGRLALDRGRLFVDVREPLAQPLSVQDTAGNFVSVRQGGLEAELYEASGVVLGYPGSPEPRKEAAPRLAARVASGEADLGGAHQQRLRVSAGQEGRFSFGGQPSTNAPAPGEVAPWRKTGYYEKR